MSLVSLRGYLPDADAPPPPVPGVGSPVAHRAWRDARDRALEAVRAGGGLVVVLGPPGTGKTSLLRELARALRRAGHDVLLRPRGDVPFEGDVRAAGDAAGDAPGDAGGALGPRVVLIDEAHRLDGAALERLGRLGARHVVLAGVSGSGEGFDRLPARATVVRLAPLPPDEVGAFTAALLARTGRDAPPPSEQAVRRLAACSGGVPRTLDGLVGASALLAASEGAARIEAVHVDRVAATRGEAIVPDGPAHDEGEGDEGEGDEDGDARRHAGADVQAGTPAVEPPPGRPPGRGRAARRRAPSRVPVGAVLGAGLCAAGVAGYLGWRSPQADPHAHGGPPVSARADAAPPEPIPTAPAAATTNTAASVRDPGFGRADTAPIPPDPAPAASETDPPTGSGPVQATRAIAPGPTAPEIAPMAPEMAAPARAEPTPEAQPTASGPVAPASPEPVQAAAPGPVAPRIAPEPASTAPEALAPVAPGSAVRTAPEPVAPAAVGPAPSLAPEPVTPEAPGRAASFAPERREHASVPPEPGRPAARPVLATLTPAQTPAARALPVGAAVQVVIYHPRDDARAAARAAGIARTLREAGMAVGEPLAAPPRGGKPGVRYFFAEDRDAALAVLERAGLAAADVQAGDARPGVLPRPGAIEIILPPG